MYPTHDGLSKIGRPTSALKHQTDAKINSLRHKAGLILRLAHRRLMVGRR